MKLPWIQEVQNGGKLNTGVTWEHLRELFPMTLAKGKQCIAVNSMGIGELIG